MMITMMMMIIFIKITTMKFSVILIWQQTNQIFFLVLVYYSE